MKKKKTGLAALLVTVMGTSAFAVDSHKAGIDSGDTAFVLISAALVMLMTPALAFFYAGMVRKKNVLSVLLQCFILRYGYNNNPFPPHNLPLTVLGAGALWLGWFGFNAGSALVADALAVNAFITTNIAAASAGLMWGIIEWKRAGAPTMLGVVTGLVAGLVAITPACGFVSPLSAVIIGAFAAAFCYLAVVFVKYRLGYDDSMDVFGVHGVGGIWGAIATGLFAQVGVNEAGTNGLLFGNPRLLLVQLVAIGATVLYSGVLTFLIYKVVAKLIGMRVDEKTKIVGLDITEHKEVGYAMD